MKKFIQNMKFRPLAVVLFLAALVVCFLTADAQSPWTLATFTPCLGVLADNISQDCDNPRIAGYEDTALIINRSDIDWTSLVFNSSNPRIVESLSLVGSATPFVVYNPRVNPATFNGTNLTYNADTGRYDKTVQFYFEGIGGDSAMNVVEPLKSGSYLMILQRKDHRGDGSFEVIGLQVGLMATAQVQDEETGYWLMTMTTSEPYAEMSLFKSDYGATKVIFDALLAQVP